MAEKVCCKNTLIQSNWEANMKLYFVTLGCDKNLVDAEHMLGALAVKGFEFTQAPEEAKH